MTQRNNTAGFLAFFFLLSLGIGDLFWLVGVLVPRHLEHGSNLPREGARPRGTGSDRGPGEEEGPARTSDLEAAASLRPDLSPRSAAPGDVGPGPEPQARDGGQKPDSGQPPEAGEPRQGSTSPRSGIELRPSATQGAVTHTEALPYIPDIRFDPGSSSLPKAGKVLLRIVDRALRERPGATVLLYGHADSSSEGAHARLSLERAKNIAGYLTRLGVQAGRITIKSFGARRPLDRDDSSMASTRNRRVEVILKP